MKSHLTVESKAPAWVDVAVKKVTALRFGTVHIVVHNGEVTQIESTEKIRFDRESTESPVSSS